MPGEHEELKWYAVYCRSRHERQVHERLKLKGIDSWVADYATRVQWGKRMRKTRKNLLPGYILVHAAMDARNYLTVLQTEGAVMFVGKRWPHLSVVPDVQVHNLQRLLMQGECMIREVSYLTVGEWVRVVAGPLQGLVGKITRLSRNKTSVIVSIDLLQRSVAVELATEFLQVIDPPVREEKQIPERRYRIPL